LALFSTHHFPRLNITGVPVNQTGTCFFISTTMKAIIKICTIGKFTPDQMAIMKRVALVLIEHNLSVKIQHKIKVTKTIKLKAV
jgi:hypothetical protein